MKEKKSAISRLFVRLTVLVGVILFLLIMYNETPLKKGKSLFYLSSSNANDVAKSLKENGYDLSGIDRFILDWVTLPKEGWYRIDPHEAGRLFFFKDLHQKQAATMRIVVFAGDTKEEVLRRLSRDMVLNEERLASLYNIYSHFSEGELLADRYIMARSADEETVIQYLLADSYKKLDSFASQEFGNDYNASKLKETMIIASIIQKESNSVKEMPYISSVIHNRLRKGMKLQMDGTLNYGKYSRTVVTPERIRNDKSLFNTYRHKGLPPEPICSFSMDALKAAVFPHESDYLFFMLSEKGGHSFAATYGEHLENIKMFRNYRKQLAEKKKAEEAKRLAILKEKEEKAKEAIKSREEKKKKAAGFKQLKSDQKSEQNVVLDVTSKKPFKTEEHNGTFENNKSIETVEDNDRNVSMDHNESNHTISASA